MLVGLIFCEPPLVAVNSRKRTAPTYRRSGFSRRQAWINSRNSSSCPMLAQKAMISAS